MKSERQIMLHSEANLLLPWYANGTLSEREHQEVKQHLAVCQACRNELELFGAIRQSAEPAGQVEIDVTEADVDRLLGKLASREAESPKPDQSTVRSWAGLKSRFGHWSLSWSAWPVVAVPALLVVVLVSGVWRIALPPTADDAAYRTLSSDNNVAQRPLRIRIVTSPALPGSELQTLVSNVEIDGELVLVGQDYYHLVLARQHPPGEVMNLLQTLQSAAGVESAELMSD